MKNMRILFITDIHQSISNLSKIDFTKYNMVFCGGDLINPHKPDIEIAKSIVDMLPSDTIIVPGNCDGDPELLNYISSKLVCVNMVSCNYKGLLVTGVGFARKQSDDIKIYREYFLNSFDKIFEFSRKSPLFNLLNYCGIFVDNSEIRVISEADALDKSSDFIMKNAGFTEESVSEFFATLENHHKGGVLLTHSPPYGFLDSLPMLPPVGSRALRTGMRLLKPDIILCGHFHELKGIKKSGNTIIFNPGALKDGRYGEIIINENNIEPRFMEI